MKEALLVFQTALARAPLQHKERKSKAQNQYAQYLSYMMIEMAKDYVQVSKNLSLRSRSILSRPILENLFRLRGAFSSETFAIKMIYSSASDYHKKCKQLLDIDPSPPPHAQEVVKNAESEASGILTEFGKDECGNGKINLFDIVREGGCESYYRSHYFQLSNYTHSNYRAAGSSPSKAGDRISDQSVLLSLCLGADTLAEHYEYEDKEQIQLRTKELYNG